MSKSKKFKFVQITDLHFKRKNQDPFYEENEALRAWLAEKIKEVKPHLILFTGDLIDAKAYFNIISKEIDPISSKPIVKEKRLDTEFLKSVQEYCELLKKIADPHCEVVFTPGNHDAHHLELMEEHRLHMAQEGSEQKEILKNHAQHDTNSEAEHLNPVYTELEKPEYHPIFQNFINYFGSQSLKGYHPLKNWPEVGIVNLNNSWLAKKRGDDVNCLHLCHQHNEEALSDLRENTNRKLTLGIMHHPKYYLHISERQFCINSNCPENCISHKKSLFKEIEKECHRIFTGHTHRQPSNLPRLQRIPDTSFTPFELLPGYRKEFNGGSQYFNPIDGLHTAQLHCFEVDLEDRIPKIHEPHKSFRINVFEVSKQLQSKAINTILPKPPISSNERLLKPRDFAIQKLDLLYGTNHLPNLKSDLSSRMAQIATKDGKLIEHEKHIQEILNKPINISSIFDHYKYLVKIKPIKNPMGYTAPINFNFHLEDLIQKRECIRHTLSEFEPTTIKDTLKITNRKDFIFIAQFVKGLVGISGTDFFLKLIKKLQSTGVPFPKSSSTEIFELKLSIEPSPITLPQEKINGIADQDFFGSPSDSGMSKIKNYFESTFKEIMIYQNIDVTIEEKTFGND